MNLRVPIIRTLFLTELRMLARDRRAIIMAVLLPMLVMPVLLAASSWTQKRRVHILETTTFRYGVDGDAEWVRTFIEEARARAEAEQRTNTAAFPFEEIPITNALKELREERIHFYVSGEADTRNVQIVFRGDRDDSVSGANGMGEALRETRSAHRIQLLEERGIHPREIALVKENDIASSGHVAGRSLGKILTAFVLLLLFSGGAVVANDLLAGEKERGTLETLLTTSAGRVEIVVAKHLVIFAVALFIAVVQCANLLFYVGLKIVPTPPGLAEALSPFVTILVLGMLLPVAAMVSGILLLISGYARTYKEAQLYFLPVILVGMLPALAPVLPGLPLRSAIALVPIANVAVAIREVLVGSFDWLFLGISWGVTAAAAGWTTRVAARFLTREKLMTASGSAELPLEGEALFSRQVLKWYAVLWALLWIVNSYLSDADIRVQLLVNLVLFFGGATALMLRRYRLSPRTVLALRPPKPAVWLGLIGAVPGGLLTASGVTRLVDLFMPVSSEMIEEFQRALIPEGMSLAELLFFLAVMPGIFEEIAFRGVLLHGLRRRLHPVALAIVVGLVFGAFHFALFRLLPTAVLGMLFATVTMLTGSIYPAMVWHAANNALGVWSAREQLPLADLHPVHYLTGTAMLAASFWIFWRNRTPYPGLRRFKSNRPT